jgi:hypothetical protein
MHPSRSCSFLIAAVVAILIAPALPAAETFKPGIATNYLTDVQGWGSEAYYASIAYPDVNGDGKPDLCARGSGGIFCAAGDGAGHFATGSLINGPAWSDASGWNQPYRYRGVRFPDLNGDGKADVCGRDMDGVVCHLSTGTGFSTMAIRGPGLPDGGGWTQERYYSTIQFPDVNGDGKADCCYRGSGGIYCLEFASTGFSGTYKPGPSEFTDSSWEDVALKYWSTIQFPDLNGDHLADVCARGGGGGTTGTSPAATGVRCWLKTAAGWGSAIVGPAWSNNNGWGVDKHSTTIRYADVSGDGKADVCARSYASVGCILFTGTTFSGGVDGPPWGDPNGWWDPKYYSTIAFPDIDADGKADVCARDAAGIACAVSSGSAFGTPYSMGANPAPSDAAGWGSPPYYATMRWVDLNSDLRKDLAIRGAAGVYSHIAGSTLELDNANWTAGTCTDAAGNPLTPTNLVLQQLPLLPGASGQPQGVRLFVKPGGFPPGEYDGAGITGGNHIQGVARLNGGAPYVLLSGDGENNGHLFAARFPNKSGFERWGGIVNGPDSADIVTEPALYAISPGDYSHAGGISVFGKFAAVPLQQDALCHGQIAFFDLRVLPAAGIQPQWKLSTVLHMTPPQDEPFWTAYDSNGCLRDIQGRLIAFHTGAVAVTQSHGSLLIAVQGDRQNSGSIRWYRSSSENILEPQSFTYLGRVSSVNGSGMEDYNGINFVRQCDGRLYLFAFFQDGTGGVFGQNRLHVFEVAELATPYPTLTLIANMVLNEHSGPDAGDEYGKFGAGAGVYVSKLGKIIIYSTQYYHNKEGLGIDPALQPLRMIEY